MGADLALSLAHSTPRPMPSAAATADNSVEAVGSEEKKAGRMARLLLPLMKWFL